MQDNDPHIYWKSGEFTSDVRNDYYALVVMVVDMIDEFLVHERFDSLEKKKNYLNLEFVEKLKSKKEFGNLPVLLAEFYNFSLGKGDFSFEKLKNAINDMRNERKQ